MDILLIAILTFVAVMCIGGMLIVMRAGRRRALQARLSRVHQGEHETYAEADANGGMVGVLGGLGKAMSSKGPSKSLRSELAKAGYHGKHAAEAYLGLKVLLLGLGLVTLTAVIFPLDLAPALKVMLILTGAVMLSFVPNFHVNNRRVKRTMEIRRTLPDAVDLLEITVTSGMGLDTAWNATTDEMRRISNTLADEMSLTNLEIHLGTPRATAIQHMAERTDAEELASLSGILLQSERFGTSVAEALRSFAISMREQRSQRAEESAEKMAVKLLIPMVIFIFPAVIVVSAGPAAIKLTDLFG